MTPSGPSSRARRRRRSTLRSRPPEHPRTCCSSLSVSSAPRNARRAAERQGRSRVCATWRGVFSVAEAVRRRRSRPCTGDVRSLGDVRLAQLRYSVRSLGERIRAITYQPVSSWPGTENVRHSLPCAVQHDRWRTAMIGPAEIEDMMLEYADAEAEAHTFGHSRSQQWPPSSWSWGSGPASDQRPRSPLKASGFQKVADGASQQVQAAER